LGRSDGEEHPSLKGKLVHEEENWGADLQKTALCGPWEGRRKKGGSNPSATYEILGTKHIGLKKGAFT